MEQKQEQKQAKPAPVTLKVDNVRVAAQTKVIENGKGSE